MLILSALLASGAPAAGPPGHPSIWNGTWRFDPGRSTADAGRGAAEAYRLTIQGGHVRWEIPEIGETVIGTTDGRPMTIKRHGKPSAMKLSVTADGPYVLRYAVTRSGRPFGAGVMTLVEGGRAWVDITWAPNDALHAAQLLYVRQRAR